VSVDVVVSADGAVNAHDHDHVQAKT